MYVEETIETYKSALKSARSSFTQRVSQGGSGYLPALDGLVRNTDVASEMNIGFYEIPLKKIVGTTSHSRATAFARNFMPIQQPNTEFAQKWMRLYEAHLTEGIRDSISVFEYLNWFYVREGNKRVSVLKYCEAYSINAEVRRIVPKRDPSDMTNTIYYEFLEFNNETRLFTLWFSRPGRFSEMLELIQSYKPHSMLSLNKYQQFESRIILPFAKIYKELGGNKLEVTTGDALLRYLKVYGVSDSRKEKTLRTQIKKIFVEFETLNSNDAVTVFSAPQQKSEKSVFSALAKRMSNKKLRVGFVYAKSSAQSGWTNAHEQGRQHIISMLGDTVETEFVENVAQDSSAYNSIVELASRNMDVIFTTSPNFNTATLKAALEFPKIDFFNCSESNSFKNVRTFFGRIFEVRYLMGLIAGALTKSEKIGYVATYPIPEVISSINAFTIGVNTVNPKAKVHVKWMYKSMEDSLSSKAAEELTHLGADLICQDDLPMSDNKSKAYGLYSTICNLETGQCEPHKHFAIPIWHWGTFYEKVLTNILNDTWKLFFEGGKIEDKPVNFWWGINSGLVDIFYSTTHVPRSTQKLVEFMRKMLMQDELSIFEGPVYDQSKTVRIADGEYASRDDIVTMNWFVTNVIGEVPAIGKEGEVEQLT